MPSAGKKRKIVIFKPKRSFELCDYVVLSEDLKYMRLQIIDFVNNHHIMIQTLKFGKKMNLQNTETEIELLDLYLF